MEFLSLFYGRVWLPAAGLESSVSRLAPGLSSRPGRKLSSSCASVSAPGPGVPSCPRALLSWRSPGADQLPDTEHLPSLGNTLSYRGCSEVFRMSPGNNSCESYVNRKGVSMFLFFSFKKVSVENPVNWLNACKYNKGYV